MALTRSLCALISRIGFDAVCNRPLKELFQLAIGAMFRRDKADRAFGQPIGNPHVTDFLNQCASSEIDERCNFRRSSPVTLIGAALAGHSVKIGKALSNRLKRLALEIWGVGRPETIYAVGQQKYLYPFGSKPSSCGDDLSWSRPEPLM